MTTLKVGILGATGAVGQRLLQLLEHHPRFEVSALFASERSAGKAYADAVTWRMTTPLPQKFSGLRLHECRPQGHRPDLVFSALPKESAHRVEPAFAAAGMVVVSNASAFRMASDVPLVIPEINPEHTGLVTEQRRLRDWAGFIATNPNCATIGLVIPLKALDDAFGVRAVQVVTMQARSGAGFPGPPEEEIGDNVLPFIGGEEDKLETEPQKILGRFTGSQIEHAGMNISASCNRVNVSDGHFESVSLSLRHPPASAADLARVMTTFKGAVADLALPSSPARLITVHEDPNRPQPKRDREADGGMTTHVGRIRPCPVLDYKLNILSHNTIRGAAGAALLNAELLVAQGLIGS